MIPSAKNPFFSTSSQRTLMLEVHTKTASDWAFPYAYLLCIRHDPTGSIELRFSFGTVTIEGQNLKALHQALAVLIILIGTMETVGYSLAVGYGISDRAGLLHALLYEYRSVVYGISMAPILLCSVSSMPQGKRALALLGFFIVRFLIMAYIGYIWIEHGVD